MLRTGIGGRARRACVDADWIYRLPGGPELATAMAELDCSPDLRRRPVGKYPPDCRERQWEQPGRPDEADAEQRQIGHRDAAHDPSDQPNQPMTASGVIDEHRYWGSLRGGRLSGGHQRVQCA